MYIWRLIVSGGAEHIFYKIRHFSHAFRLWESSAMVSSVISSHDGPYFNKYRPSQKKQKHIFSHLKVGLCIISTCSICTLWERKFQCRGLQDISITLFLLDLHKLQWPPQPSYWFPSNQDELTEHLTQHQSQSRAWLCYWRVCAGISIILSFVSTITFKIV